ncbi:MAG TPA: FAD:protein FMN transferase [Bryobacteraceae bacterium]|nr:FAD:protein FMN transferase [Bryobacteraceae bacterium]
MSLSVRKQLAMDTLVTIAVAGAGADDAIERAFGWFHDIEERCTRFDPNSELMRLTSCAGVAVPVSPILFESVQFAIRVAEESGGAFDPAVGHQMERRGFNRNHRTGQTVRTPISPEPATYRDIRLDPDRRTIQLQRPLILDLGAVVKGLAIDLAARELQPFSDFSIDAGGDLYAGGCNPEGEPWRIGIRHPRREGEIIYQLRITNQAVCTSGDYERGRHILDPRTGQPAASAASVTVVAPNAMLADALSTAAFVLAPAEGIALLERMGVDGFVITPDLERFETEGLRHAA